MESRQGIAAQQAKRMAGTGNRYELTLNDSVSGNSLRHLIVRVQLPGISNQKLDVSLSGNILSIKQAASPRLTLTTLLRGDIVGKSYELHACLNQVVRAAESEDCVLICGETGTGKELFARATHLNSRRAVKEFVIVDCRSLPEAIAEKLLFGEPRDSDFGPVGLLAQAASGTLFLDEVGDLPKATQQLFKKLLQEKKYRPVGSRDEIAIDFRLIVATNRDLGKLAAQGKFDRRLLALLQPLLIEVPPLRNRLDDIEQLTEYFLQRHCRTQNLVRKDRSPEFMTMLKKYPWPGNVRELENSLEQALLAAKNQKTLFPKDLPAHIRVQVKKSSFEKNRSQDNLSRQPFFGGLFMADNPL